MLLDIPSNSTTASINICLATAYLSSKFLNIMDLVPAKQKEEEHKSPGPAAPAGPVFMIPPPGWMSKIQEKITAIMYFVWIISIPFFFYPVEIIALAALSIPAFAFYSYVRPYYTYVTAVHTISFALLVVVALILGPFLPLIPGINPQIMPPKLW